MHRRCSLADGAGVSTAGLHAAALGGDQGQCGGVHAVAAGDHVPVLSAVEICGMLCQVLQPPGIQALHHVQAGSDALLMAKDNTGATPAELAVDKGHRYLGLNLADYRG